MYRYIFQLCILFVLINSGLLAQRVDVKESYSSLMISYSMQVNSDQPMLGLLLSGAACTLAHTDQWSSIFFEDAMKQMTVYAVQNATDDNGIIKMDMFGKKQYIKLSNSSSSDVVSTFKEYAEQMKKTDVIKEVAGWPCQKHVGRFTINSKKVDMVVYLAKINYTGSHPIYSAIYESLGGVPLRILVRNEYGIFQLAANKVQLSEDIKPILKRDLVGYELMDPNSIGEGFPQISK